MPIVYGRGRYPKSVGKRICRGCHAPVPKPRRSWCSQECYDKFEPTSVRIAVSKRDKMICQLCGLDIKKAHNEWLDSRPSICLGFDVFGSPYKRWYANRPQEEYDHIVPFCEGGLTVAENMRLLCNKCHREVTKEFHKRRSAECKKTGMGTQ